MTTRRILREAHKHVVDVSPKKVKDVRAVPEATTVPTSPAPNPICGHDHRIHYLGGGLWVCFECWARLLFGGRRTK